MAKSISIGCGSAWASDWLEPGADLANSGLVDYMAFDCLAERTLALAQIRKIANPKAGQDPRIGKVVELFAPFLGRGKTVIGNFGCANPDAGTEDVMIGLRKAGLKGTRIGVIRGDDVLRQVIADDLPLPERGVTAKQVEKQLVSAHAYIGAEPIVDLLGKQAKFILGGRLADPSLFVAPICHELGWSLTDWNKVGQATVVGHLLECGIHGAGGNFADPPKRVLPDLHNIGAPMATVRDDGDVVITKLPGTGGGITEQVVKTQLFYEIHDPATYLTPDITADFTDVTVKSVGPDQVKVAGGKGRERPKTLKVLVGINLGFNVFGESSFGGPGCVERARLTIDVMKKRIERHAPGAEELRFDLHGMNALFGDAMKGGYPPEVRLRIAARCKTRELAEALHDQMEFVYFAAAAAGGVTKQITPAIGVTPAYLDRSKVKLETEVVVA